MTIDEYRYEHAPTEAHLTAIGRIIIESSKLEHVIELALWQVMIIPSEFGELITNRPNLGQRIDLLLQIISVAFPQKYDKDKFRPINDELSAIKSMRNYIVHADWTHGTTPHMPMSLNFRNEKGEIIPRCRHWTSSDLERIAARIGRVTDELIFYLTARRVDLPPWRRKSWKRYQLPAEPKWTSKKKRVFLRRRQPYPRPPSVHES